MRTRHHSWCTGRLSEGCRLCVKGRKLVLFVTGLCGQRCFYCPVGEQKFGHDVVFANEWKVLNPDNPVELIKEVRLTEAKGVGITGGDPLVKVDRCCQYIKLLKETFGREFHVHLYTPLKLVTRERLQRLYEAGLDEIRFHLDLNDRSLWDRLSFAEIFDWDVGVEIPAVPGYDEKIRTLIDYVAGKVKFLNLNELELSDTMTSHYKMSKFRPRDDKTYGVMGSREMAFKMLRHAKGIGLLAHFCTVKLKDSVQVANRLKLRARHAALPFESETDEGMLVRGCVYIDELKPGFGYRRKLKLVNADVMIPRLHDARESIVKLGADEVVIDPVKFRLILPSEKVKELAVRLKDLNLVPALVEEYPTADALELDIMFL